MKGKILTSSGSQAKALWDVDSDWGRRFDQKRPSENMHIFSNTKHTNMHFTVKRKVKY